MPGTSQLEPSGTLLVSFLGSISSLLGPCSFNELHTSCQFPELEAGMTCMEHANGHTDAAKKNTLRRDYSYNMFLR